MQVNTCSARPVLTDCSLKNLDYQIDPYVGCGHLCLYCYALKTAETDWSKEVLMHSDIVGQLRSELSSIPPQKIYMGYETDPYQPSEAEHRQTRKVLELLLEQGYSASILTKSSVVARDIDILRQMENASVSVSVAFTDNGIRELFEANTEDTELRIEALGKIKEAGIGTSALLCPVIPHITDVRSLIDDLAPSASVIWTYGLHMDDRSDKNWLNVKRILDEHFSSMSEEIEEIIFQKDHTYWKELRIELESLQDCLETELNIHV